MFGRLREDIDVAYRNDPAARSRFEVFLVYPGIHALCWHRIAHRLWNGGWIIAARFLAHLSRMVTGVEIHPAAHIGRGVFIDHGIGIVIGETAVVGDGCLIYKGVVLGSTTSEKVKRHPSLGKNVVVGSNACVLGNINIGDYARIGSGSVVTKDVPPHATVVGVPGRIIRQRDNWDHNEGAPKLNSEQLPDPVAEAIMVVLKENSRLRERIVKIEKALNLSTNESISISENESEVLTLFMKNFNDGGGI